MPPLSCLKCGPLSLVSSVAPSLLFQVCPLSPVSDVAVDLTVQPERNDSFIQGDNVILTCNATNPPGVTTSPLTFIWVYIGNTGGGVISTDDSAKRISIVREDFSSVLTITNIQDRSDVEGTYMCRVSNRLPIADSVTEQIIINVICERVSVCVHYTQ